MIDEYKRAEDTRQHESFADRSADCLSNGYNEKEKFYLHKTLLSHTKDASI
jgi:hypothetical protein